MDELPDRAAVRLLEHGIAISGHFLADAFTSPITLGILFGYLVGKPIGIAGTTWLVTKLSRGRLRPPVGWAAVAGTGMLGGIGFTVALQISALAFTGPRLEEAKVGILSAALCAATATWVLFRLIGRLPAQVRVPAVLGPARSSSISPPRSTRNATTSAARTTPR